MKLVYLIALLGSIHLLAGGVGTVIMSNLVSQTGIATYGGSRGFLPDDDSPYSAFGRYLYGDGEPERREPGEGPIGLLRYGVIEGTCLASSAVTFVIILATFSYPAIDIIPTEGFGLWVRVAIHVMALFGFVVALVRLLEMAIQMGVFSNVYLLIALGLISSAGLISNIVANVANIGC